MKKSIWILTGVVFTISALLPGCNAPGEKVRDAKKEVVAAKVILDKAQQEYKEELINYRKETAMKIAENEKMAADFRVAITNQKKKAKAAAETKLAELEMKNEEMKIKLKDYQSNSKDGWQAFKTEFNRDMNELGKAFKDLTVKNEKE